LQKKVSIGLPVYNGERFLRLKLESLLNQTYKNFELIISNNGSTDMTHKICCEYKSKDNRIKYFHHKENNSADWNFKFVLDKAECDYFMWTSVDDMLLPSFIEKNLKNLENKSSVVASISKISSYEPQDEFNFMNTKELEYSESMKKLRNKIRKRDTISLEGNFENKAREYMKRSTCQVFYSIFDTQIIRKCFISETFLGNDWAIFLNVLKYGDLRVVEEVLMQQYERGGSGKGLISASKQFNHGIGVVFPWYALTKWCLKNLGLKFFFKNIDYFIQLNLEGCGSLLLDIVHKNRR